MRRAMRMLTTAAVSVTVAGTTPAPPAAPRWACGGKGECVQAAIGHSTKSTCASSCSAPPTGMKYNCGGYGQCYQKKTGDSSSLDKCTKSCANGPQTPMPTIMPTLLPTPGPGPPGNVPTMAPSPAPTRTPRPTPAPTKKPTPAPTPAPPRTMTTYHIVPDNYTGLANKNTGDVSGDIQFTIKSMHACADKTNGRCLEHTILEWVDVLIDDDWADYRECNLQKNGRYICCNDPKEHPPCKETTDCRVGREKKKHFANVSDGYWYSFPQCGEALDGKFGKGKHWSVKGKVQRISGKCLGDAWRTKAGGCKTDGEKPPVTCTDALDECVQRCISKMDIRDLQLVWYHLTADNPECPQIPFSGHTPAPVPPTTAAVSAPEQKTEGSSTPAANPGTPAPSWW